MIELEISCSKTFMHVLANAGRYRLGVGITEGTHDTILSRYWWYYDTVSLRYMKIIYNASWTHLCNWSRKNTTKKAKKAWMMYLFNKFMKHLKKIRNKWKIILNCYGPLLSMLSAIFYFRVSSFFFYHMFTLIHLISATMMSFEVVTMASQGQPITAAPCFNSNY